MQNQWDQRYAAQEYVYGTEPNNFLKEKLTLLKPGRILFPAEGEGRNAVYAASLGWQTDAFDLSVEGQKKALLLADTKGVTINYNIESLDNWHPVADQYDCITLIFVHLPDGLRQQVHHAVIRALKPGGILILEAFTLKQLTRASGGPKTADMLYTSEMLQDDFKLFSSVETYETLVTLDEGPLHQGLAEVVRLSGFKAPL
jgi:2-polyprenyl-3-methyl-5-hydroxy-6-metoxy-1,4-benzoquinol methylase